MPDTPEKRLCRVIFYTVFRIIAIADIKKMCYNTIKIKAGV